MPISLSQIPLYYKDGNGNYQRFIAGSDVSGYRTAAAQDVIDAQQDANIGIVQNTNTATQNITAGQYVIWHGALYTARTAIASGATLSSSNLTAVSNGGLNDLKNSFAPTVSILTTGTTVDIKYIKSGNVVTVTTDSNAKIDMNAGTSYTVDAAMVWPPYTRQTFETFCRYGVAAYFDLNPSQNKFTIIPRANIAINANMAFSFSYITSA